MNRAAFEQYIRSFDFKGLFLDLGWDKDATKGTIVVDKEKYVLQAVAQKSGFKIFICASSGKLPDKATRLKIQSKAVAFSHLHLIIFYDEKKTEQKWLLVTREANKPIKRTETSYNIQQKPELLYQRASGLIFELDEQDNITIVDVQKKVTANFHKNSENVTKKFYTEFKTEHKSFISFIKGINEVAHKDWYASLMMNRLMFCYFIQKKGFLDDDKDYLRHKLEMCREKKGTDNFYSFYRWLMKFLFFGGLNAPEQDEDIKKEIGRVPYLNGGLFDEHELEKKYPDIDISDKAFEKVFAFFDRYNWHLDIRPDTSGKEINPDVIGYIFEKYINDRAQMGAYYTKEDITGYISKNCIIPYLMDAVKRKYPKAFEAPGEIWTMVKQSGDSYIYEAVKKGVELPLPDFIRRGINPEIEKRIVKDVLNNPPKLLELRKDWNKPAPEEYALPTEIWRTVVERRKRYQDIRSKVDGGNILDVNDFITYNLDIIQFAQDVVETTNDAEFLKHFYQELENVTILDPTCGSGAFLFAALNILEPLYEGCIHRMEAFIEEDKKGKHKFFEETISRVTAPEHFNLKYFIYKTIILRNLYGVDIMNEAVEIAKLRLFLKLVAEVEVNPRKKNLGLEPLPDIDFNIRAGNTLVGFASEAETKEAIEFTKGYKSAKGKLNEQRGFDFDNDFDRISEECQKAADAFEHYKRIQADSSNRKLYKRAKEELIGVISNLKDELNTTLHKRYYAEIKFEKWVETHQPFHWFAEFYEIIHDKKGFDVIIGNPPYIAMSKIDYKITVKNFSSSDIYGYVIRRAIGLLNNAARHGFIVMHNLAFSGAFKDVRAEIRKHANAYWLSFFARIPAGLFSGDVRVRNCVYLMSKSVGAKKIGFTTQIHRWFNESRSVLFNKLNYTKFSSDDVFPMYYDNILSEFFSGTKKLSNTFFHDKTSKQSLFYKQSAYNWIAVSFEPAPCFMLNGEIAEQTQVKPITIKEGFFRDLLILLLNGKLFFSFWLSYGDEFHVTKDDLQSLYLPIEKIEEGDLHLLSQLAKEFVANLNNTLQYKINAGKKVWTFNTSKLWHITDQSDLIFCKYLTPKPFEVREAIENHVYSTVLTQDDTIEDE